jgi:hypothetical protein
MKMVVFWNVAPRSLMMEAVKSPETSVNTYQATGCNIPEGSHLHNILLFKLKICISYMRASCLPFAATHATNVRNPISPSLIICAYHSSFSYQMATVTVLCKLNTAAFYICLS